jgi:hypothetical protein
MATGTPQGRGAIGAAKTGAGNAITGAENAGAE